jgi:dTDP-4-dehydrorhamnose reductase
LTKYEAEKRVKACQSPWIIARVALVMGYPWVGQGNSFMGKMRAALKAGREVGFPEEEIRTPIDVITLSTALLEFAGTTHQGIFHLAGNDIANRYEISRLIAIAHGFNPTLVVVKNADDQPARAPRPRDVSLDNRKVRDHLLTPMVGLATAIEKVCV